MTVCVEIEDVSAPPPSNLGGKQGKFPYCNLKNTAYLVFPFGYPHPPCCPLGYTFKVECHPNGPHERKATEGFLYRCQTSTSGPCSIPLEHWRFHF